jgi:hypothetical protein
VNLFTSEYAREREREKAIIYAVFTISRPYFSTPLCPIAYAKRIINQNVNLCTSRPIVLGAREREREREKAIIYAVFYNK